MTFSNVILNRRGDLRISCSRRADLPVFLVQGLNCHNISADDDEDSIVTSETTRITAKSEAKHAKPRINKEEPKKERVEKSENLKDSPESARSMVDLESGNQIQESRSREA
ncbi:hypothetical protein SLEP1_g14731 [Rubroshorea leprosula]|uniref:Uncharacterized protein n=1 Tax=Rubroshorea leprosula TaxID=152421 RepID=A0AAV5IVP1_9ROSI|nr:hypothetical protein SLEP1_g14731 [Rubroshorea leprosula]